MPSKNVYEVIGRCGKHVKSGRTDSGRDWCTFSVSTSNPRKQPDGSYSLKDANGEWYPSTWHNVVVWGALARDAMEFQNGDYIYASGKLEKRKFTDRNEVEREVCELNARECYRLNWEKREYTGGGYQRSDNDYSDAGQGRGSSVPFDSFDVGDLGPPLGDDEAEAILSGSGQLSPGD